MNNPFEAWLVALALLVGATVIGLSVARRRKRLRRGRLRTAALPPRQAAALQAALARYPGLPASLRQELAGRVNEFLHDKQFVGCDGLQLDDEMRVTIAANACLLVLNRDAPTFPNVRTILIYPGAFVAEYVEQEEWLEHEIAEARSGESWERGPLILAWDEVQADLAAADGRNVIVHEFAHKLDDENPDGEGLPPLPDALPKSDWSRIMQREFDALNAAALKGEATLIDPYGAESPAEFFAVITETFLSQPGALQRCHPDLYGLLCDALRIDPANWENSA